MINLLTVAEYDDLIANAIIINKRTFMTCWFEVKFDSKINDE